MNVRFKMFIACVLLIVIGWGENPTFAQSTEPSTVYLPAVFKPLPPLRFEGFHIANTKGYQSIVGKVKNISQNTVYYPSLSVKVSIDNEPFQVYDVSTELPATFPSETNLFSTPTESGTFLDGEVSVQVDVISWSYVHEPEYLPIKVYYKQLVGDFVYGYLTGVIRNDNPVKLSNIEIMYAANNFPGFAIPDKMTLAPGEMSAFVEKILYPSLDVEDYTLWVQGTVDY